MRTVTAEFRFRTVFNAALLLLSTASAAVAQSPSTSAIHGTVRDTAGTPIPAAAVELLHLPTGATANAITDATGRYRAADLRPGGPYRIRVTSLGFGTFEQNGLELRLGETARLDFELSQQPITLGAIEARAEGISVFSTSRTGPATHIGPEIIQAQPTLERNFLELAALSPMVRVSEEGGLSISGQNERYNAILVDGALLQDVFGAGQTGLPGAEARAKAIPLDAIQEFQVQVAPYDVRSGGFTGGLMNAVTRSGTNEWQGRAFGLYRDEALFGTLSIDGVQVAPVDYSKNIFGFTVGGPIRRDAAHMFLAVELEGRREPAPGVHFGLHDVVRIGVAPDSMARFQRLLRDVHGYDPGVAERITLTNPLANVFGRLDFDLGGETTLTLRHNYARAERETAPRREAIGPYELSSSSVDLSSSTHATTARLVSRLDDNRVNEVMLNYQRTHNAVHPEVAPQIDMEVWSSLDEAKGTRIRRTLRAGAPYYLQQDDLTQHIFQMSDALSIARGDKVTTFGAGVDLFRFDHTFLPGQAGRYFFWGLSELEINRPHFYEVQTLLPGADPKTRFSVLQPNVFAQREWTAPGGLVLHFGVRLERPVYLGSPERNEAVEDSFDIRTDRLPSGFAVSPRFGFNWQSDATLRTQVRGGFGAFTGRIPFVWMANAFAQTGTRTEVLTCENIITPDGDTIRVAPDLRVGAAAPASCIDPRGEDRHALVVGFDQEFAFPKQGKLSLGIDQELPFGIGGSVEALYLVTLGDVVLQERNLPKAETRSDRNFGERLHFGSNDTGGVGYRPRRRDPRFVHVLAMTNTNSAGHSYAVTGELRWSFRDRMHLDAAYAYARSYDLQSLIATDAFANFGSTATGQHPNLVDRRPSSFDRPHKLVVSARSELWERIGGAELSFRYVGQSGAPYSYVYGHDITGDGYPGVGVPLDASNDLLWVPGDFNRDVPGASIATKQVLRDLIPLESCLDEARGQTLKRNACRTPWTNRVDARATQRIHTGRYGLELTADLLNVLNLFNSEWGRVWDAPPLVQAVELNGWQPDGGGIRLSYSGPLQRAPGGVGPTLPHTVVVPASQWQAQVGARVTFQ